MIKKKSRVTKFTDLEPHMNALRDERDSLRIKVKSMEEELERLRKLEAIVSDPLFKRFMSEASNAL